MGTIFSDLFSTFAFRVRFWTAESMSKSQLCIEAIFWFVPSIDLIRIASWMMKSLVLQSRSLSYTTTEWQKSGTLYYKSSEALKFGVWK